MALERKRRLDWSDIQEIYSSLNEARDKFDMTKVSIPEEKKKKAVVSNVSDLKNEITSMLTNKYIAEAEITTDDIKIPERRTLIYPSPFVMMKNTIADILDVCPHNGSYCPSECTSEGGGESYGCNTFHSDSVNTSQSWCSGFNHTGLGTNSF